MIKMVNSTTTYICKGGYTNATRVIRLTCTHNTPTVVLIAVRAIGESGAGVEVWCW